MYVSIRQHPNEGATKARYFFFWRWGHYEKKEEMVKKKHIREKKRNGVQSAREQ